MSKPMDQAKYFGDVPTRMEASRDLLVIPGARGHEYVRVGQYGIRSKLGIDATAPFAERARFQRYEFMPAELDAKNFTTDRNALRQHLQRR